MPLPDLFLRESHYQESAMTSLPQDMDLWAETIVSKLRERLPQAKDMSIKISFLKKDEEQGTSTGSAVITNPKLNKTVYVPIITKNFKMYPLDILMIAKQSKESGFEIMPFTKEIFEEMMFNGDVFDELGKPLDRLRQLYGDSQGRLVFPPSHRNVHASANILDSLQGTLWKQDIKEITDALKATPGILVGYEKRANLGVLRKIAQSCCPTEKIEKKFQNISIIKKDLNNNKFNVLTVSDEAYEPLIEDMTREDLLQAEDCRDTLHEVEQTGEKMIFRDLSPESSATVTSGVHDPSSYQKVNEVPVEAKVYGSYKVQDKNLVFHKGVVIPNVIDYDMKILPTKIFIGNGKAAYQTKIPAIKTDEKPEIKFQEPRVGMTGTFVACNATNAIATFPVTIRAIVEDFGSETHIIAMDLNGKKIKIKRGGLCIQEPNKDFAMVADLKKITKVKDYYILPHSFKFVAMDTFTDLAESVESIIQKQAASYRDASPVRVIHTGGSQFALKGPDLIKMANAVGWSANNLSAVQAVFLLSAKRCPLTKIAEALKSAGMAGESSVHGLPRVTWDRSEKQVKLASKLMDEVRKLRVNLVKEASYFDDSQVVDSILSLNFINPENIDKFVDYIPLFEQASRALAESLLGARLGMTEIPEQAVATAMYKLLDVNKGLRRLKMRGNDE